MKKIILVFLILISSITFAKEFGFISGTIIDKETGDTLPGVQIIVEGTDCGAVTNLEGFYEIYNIPPGKYDLFIEYLGYNSVKVVGIEVSADSTTTFDLKLDQGSS